MFRLHFNLRLVCKRPLMATLLTNYCCQLSFMYNDPQIIKRQCLRQAMHSIHLTGPATNLYSVSHSFKSVEMVDASNLSCNFAWLKCNDTFFTWIVLNGLVLFTCHRWFNMDFSVTVARSLVFCVVFCRSLFVLFHLVIVLSVLLRFIYFDYPFVIF
jgi:hypothetical protein